MRSLILKPWSAIASSAIGELSVKFDFIMGCTPADTGTVAKPTIVYMSGNNSYTGIANVAGNMPGVASAERSWQVPRAPGLPQISSRASSRNPSMVFRRLSAANRRRSAM